MPDELEGSLGLFKFGDEESTVYMRAQLWAEPDG